MSKRVEQAAHYEANPIMRTCAADLPEDVQNAFRNVMAATIENGDLEWIDNAGFIGLSNQLEHRFYDVRPECEGGCLSACSMEVDIMADAGSIGHAVLEFRCPLISEPKKKDADMREKKCKANQEATLQAFGDHMIRTAAEVENEKINLEAASAEVDKVQDRISGLL